MYTSRFPESALPEFGSENKNNTILGGLLVAVFLATLLVGACGEESAAGTPSAFEPITAGVVTRLVGAGPGTTDEFDLKQDVVLFDVNYQGDGPLTIYLVKAPNRLIDLVAEADGAFVGRDLQRVTTAGTYVLEVTSSGAWEIEVSQPCSEAPELPECEKPA